MPYNSFFGNHHIGANIQFSAWQTELSLIFLIGSIKEMAANDCVLATQFGIGSLTFI